MALDVASNYAAAFRPQGPFLDGFNLALSSSGADLLSAIPSQNAAMDLALAQATLPELGATARQRLVTEAELRNADLTRRSNRRSSALSMLSSILGSGLGQQIASSGRTNPYDSLSSMNTFLDSERQRRSQRTTGSRSTVGSALQQLFS